MQDAYQLSQLAATVFLIVFSIGFGHLRLRHFGFGFHGLLDRQIDYEERHRTPIGKQATAPLLMRHAGNPWCLFGWSVVPIVLNGLILLWLYWLGLYSLVPVLAVPLAVVEFALGWWLQKKLVPMYQADYDNYMQLTAPDNRSFIGELKDRDMSFCPQKEPANHLLSRGKLVSAFVQVPKGGPIMCLRLFLPLSVHPVPGEGERVRIFYRPDKEVQGHAVEGSVVGCQRVRLEPPLGTTFDELEQRVAAKY